MALIIERRDARIRFWAYPPVLAAPSLAAIFLLSGCGSEMPSTPLGRMAAAMFDSEGLVKDKSKQAFLASTEGTSKEKIDLMMMIIEKGPVIRHGAATEIIANIDDPYRVDALMKVFDTYKGNEATRNNIFCWAVTGLGFSMEPRAYEKLFDMLNTSKDPFLKGSILHDIGFASINAKRFGKELSPELYDKVDDNIRKCLNDEELSVREHAARALDRLHGKLVD